MDPKLRQQLQRLLSTSEDASLPGVHLLDDAQRLWNRLRRFMSMKLANVADETVALEVACYALQLPFRQRKPLPAGKLGRTSLKDRAEQSAELLVSQAGDEIDDVLLDRATRILQELHHKSPMLDAARLLADALNLDDFGLSGLLTLSVQLARQGDGLQQIVLACDKREQYGYWDARLRDGFHYDPVRQIARRRLEHARRMIKLLHDELSEDLP
jgi:hypothetical protein